MLGKRYKGNSIIWFVIYEFHLSDLVIIPFLNTYFISELELIGLTPYTMVSGTGTNAHGGISPHISTP